MRDPKHPWNIGRVGYRLKRGHRMAVSCLVPSGHRPGEDDPAARDRPLGCMDADVRGLIRLLREEGYAGTLYRDDTVDIVTGYPGDVYTRWNVRRSRRRTRNKLFRCISRAM